MTTYIISYIIVGLMVAAVVANECFQPEWHYYSGAIKFRVIVYLAIICLLWPSILIMCVIWSISARGRNVMRNWMLHDKFSTKEMDQ